MKKLKVLKRERKIFLGLEGRDLRPSSPGSTVDLQESVGPGLDREHKHTLTHPLTPHTHILTHRDRQ